MTDPQFILKTTPPRAPRRAVQRQKLIAAWNEMRDLAAVSVSAPAGFGKTTLLVQWRRLWLEQGAIVAWATLDEQDDPVRFASLLLFAMRQASGRAAFDKLLLEHVDAEGRGRSALTGLLGEIAALATPTALMLDDAHRLPAETLQGSLGYLLLNAPPNLHVVVGTRRPPSLPTVDLAARGQYASLGTEDLRLELFESVSILEKRFGARLSLDDAVRMHEAAEGWPLGLQLAATAIERAPDLHHAVETLSGRRGDIEQYFVESSFSRYPPEVADFLVRIAILDELTPELCEAVTGCASAAAMLDQLSAESPMAVVGEARSFMRIHGLGRDFLLGRFEKLPPAEQRELHRRAADWFAARSRFGEAGRHALAAGDPARARSYAKRSLWELGTKGRLREALGWVEQLPDETLVGDDELRLVAAWVMALGNRPQQALSIAERVRASPSATKETRFTCALVAATAAVYLDRPGLLERVLASRDEVPVSFPSPVHEGAYRNTVALVAIFRGATDEARRLEAPGSAHPASESLSLELALGRVVVALSHLWDGESYKAEALLRPALDAAERQTGRRSVQAALFAVPLAAATYDRGDALGARALLANRLDVVEQTGLPESIQLAYRTLAAIAAQHGDERAALDALGTLQEIGRSRGMPRLEAISLAEQARIHAVRRRVETAAAAQHALDALEPRFEEPDFLPFRPLFRLLCATSRAYVALAGEDWGGAERELRRCDELATELHRGRHRMVVKALRAVLAHERGLDASPLLQEVIGLMELSGSARLLADTHPLAVRMAEDMQQRRRVERAPGGEAVAPRVAETHGHALAAGGLLTPKEAEVLRHLNGGMTNKLIAKQMDISDETVKWHLRNLFSKLHADTRRHAVHRARLLGLIEG